MVVGKINFTNNHTNAILQQKQPVRNVAFTGTPVKYLPNINESKIVKNNWARRAFDSVENYLNKAKQLLTGAKTTKTLELNVPHKVNWTDFASVEGELTKAGTKVIKNKEGKVVQEFSCYDGKTIYSLTEYDTKTGGIAKYTQFNKDGTIKKVKIYVFFEAFVL